LVVAADLSLGELVQEETPLLVEGLGGYDLAAEVAEVGEPVAEVERELLVEVFAELLGERGRVAGGGDGDLEVSAANDGRAVEVAEGRVVDGVAEDSGSGGLGEDSAVDGRVIGGSDNEEGSCEVALLIETLMKRELAGGGLFIDGFAGFWCDDGHGCVGGAEGGDL